MPCVRAQGYCLGKLLRTPKPKPGGIQVALSLAGCPTIFSPLPGSALSLSTRLEGQERKGAASCALARGAAARRWPRFSPRSKRPRMPGLRGAVLAAAAMLLFSATAGALPQVPSPSHQRRLGFMSDKKAAKIPSPPAKSPQQQKDGGQSKANQKITWDNQQEQPPPGYLSQLSPSPAPESSSVLGKLWRKTFGKDKDKGDKNKMKQPVAAVYTGPVGKGKAKFDDKAAEQAVTQSHMSSRPAMIVLPPPSPRPPSLSWRLKSRARRWNMRGRTTGGAGRLSSRSSA